MDTLRAQSLIYLIICLLFSAGVKAQKANVYGKVSDENGQALELVNIAVEGLPGGTVSDKYGFFDYDVPAGREITLLVSFIGFDTRRIPLNLNPGASEQLSITLSRKATDLPETVISDRPIRKTSLTRVDPKLVSVIPSVAGGVESVLKTLPGVASSNELSSQYSVRGGNYDENLVYVNDVEIYRPFLIRSGQQEGLSFVNSDLVSSILFSAGGFEAKYGDKMSSVLDIKYKKPQEFGGSFALSLLGASLHLEGTALKDRFTYLMGARQKSNQYLLNSLETSGQYKPSFTDIQTSLTYDVSKKLELSFLGNFARNAYTVIPESRETDFGTINEAYRFTVYFEGQEVDRFDTWLGAVSADWYPDTGLKMKFTASAYRSTEYETFDILGQYFIGRLETDFGKDDFGNVTDPIGVGSFLDHARNYLTADVINFQYLGSRERRNSFLQWGLKYQHEAINDELREWQMLDSAGYSLPHPADFLGDSSTPRPLVLNRFVSKSIDIASNRYSGFIQQSWDIPADSNSLNVTAGIRSQYWDLNGQFLISPRASLAFEPNWERSMLFRFAAGIYYQPPFYRELRDPEGNLNTNLKAQRSIHLVAGTDYDFIAWGRPFKLVSEIYYKFLNNLVPYVIDNVRIRYDAENHAKGYATGIDIRVNGEFVRGIESWASLSVMETREDILDDFYFDENGQRIEPGYIPRPTDQRVNFGLFFQDYLPSNPTFKMHLNLLFGSSLPFGAPGAPKYQHTLRIPPYRRVDIGFSKQLKEDGAVVRDGHLLSNFRDVWVTVEVFNLLQVNNTISYIWIADITNRLYAIPNYLTPRMLNVKLVAKF